MSFVSLIYKRDRKLYKLKSMCFCSKDKYHLKNKRMGTMSIENLKKEQKNTSN